MAYGASEWSRTTDTGIFSPLLYHLSYRGIRDFNPLFEIYGSDGCHCHKPDGDPEGARTPDLQRDRLAY